MSKIYKIAIPAFLVIIAVVIGLSVNQPKTEPEQQSDTSNVASDVQIKEISAEEKTETLGAKVIAYYFLTTYRCNSCYMIEKYTKEAIENNFGDDLISGKLIFKAVNIEEKENRHFVDDYQLYTKSVVLSLMKDDKEIKFKNLEKVWEYLNNKDKFFQYIKEETQKFLDETKTEEKQ